MPKQNQAKAPKGGNKLRRCSKDAHYYEKQFLKTAANKLRRATKRSYWRAYWRALRISQAAQPE